MTTQPTKKAPRPVRVRVYQDALGEWRWRAVAGNGTLIAASGEGYKRKAYAIKSAHRLAECLFLVEAAP